MVNFNVSIGNMINIIIIAAGLGICSMIILQVSSGARLTKEVTRYFQFFFGTVMVYIGCHLLRQLMEGFPGTGIRIALHVVTFLEFSASALMAWLFSMLTLYIADPDRHRELYSRLFAALIVLHAVLMLVTFVGYNWAGTKSFKTACRRIAFLPIAMAFLASALLAEIILVFLYFIDKCFPAFQALSLFIQFCKAVVYLCKFCK